MPYFRGIIRGLREGSGTEENRASCYFEDQVYMGEGLFSSQAASLEYLVALDGDSQAPFTELRWNLVQIFSLRNKVLLFLLLLLLSS